MVILAKLKNILPPERILQNECMKKHTTFKIGGEADIMVLPESREEILACLKFAKDEGIMLHVFGNGSNLLVSDKGIRGISLKLFKNFSEIKVDGDEIYAESGAVLSKVSSVAAASSLSGLEFASGIPGTIGGAVYMNAGAYGGEMSDVVIETEYIDKNLEIKTINEHDFSYRHSIFQENGGIILSTRLRLKKGDKENIMQKINELSEARISKQPVNMPSAGSAFKRPEGHFAAKLIDDCGLRGYNVGGAAISEKHTGFAVNTGGATCEDVKKLLENVKNIVFEKTGVYLEPEIKFIGEN